MAKLLKTCKYEVYYNVELDTSGEIDRCRSAEGAVMEGIQLGVEEGFDNDVSNPIIEAFRDIVHPPEPPEPERTLDEILGL